MIQVRPSEFGSDQPATHGSDSSAAKGKKELQSAQAGMTDEKPQNVGGHTATLPATGAMGTTVTGSSSEV